MSDPEDSLMVNCGPHGRRQSTVVCRHLLQSDGEPAGFIENCSDPDDLQAWCYHCEEKFQLEDGMTEAFRTFNDYALVCVVCYGDIKARHSLPHH